MTWIFVSKLLQVCFNGWTEVIYSYLSTFELCDKWNVSYNKFFRVRDHLVHTQKIHWVSTCLGLMWHRLTSITVGCWCELSELLGQVLIPWQITSASSCVTVLPESYWSLSCASLVCTELISLDLSFGAWKVTTDSDFELRVWSKQLSSLFCDCIRLPSEWTLLGGLSIFSLLHEMLSPVLQGMCDDRGFRSFGDSTLGILECVVVSVFAEISPLVNDVDTPAVSSRWVDSNLSLEVSYWHDPDSCMVDCELTWDEDGLEYDWSLSDSEFDVVGLSSRDMWYTKPSRLEPENMHMHVTA